MRVVAIVMGLLLAFIAVETWRPEPRPVRRARETHRLTPERPRTIRH